MFFWNSLCLFYDLMDVGNLISGSSAFSKSSLNTWKLTVHVLLKPGFKNFEHYSTSVWYEWNCEVVWAHFDISFLRDWNETWPFPVLCWIFKICWHIEFSTFTASSFRIWNSSTEISSPPLALFGAMFPLGPLDFIFQDVWPLVSDHTIVTWILIVWINEFYECSLFSVSITKYF